MSYAATTDVPVDRSKRHIEELLLRAGAEGYHTGWQAPSGDDPGWDAIEFIWKKRQIRFRISRQTGSTRSPRNAHRRRMMTADQRDRQRWRILFLVVKAKIEAVEAGVAMFEEEFLSFIVTANGKTVGEVLVPRLETTTGPLQLAAGDVS